MQHPLTLVCRLLGGLVGIGSILWGLWLAFFTAESAVLWLLLGILAFVVLWTLAAILERLVHLENCMRQIEKQITKKDEEAR